MKTKTVYLVQKVLITYSDDESFKEVVHDLYEWPNSFSLSGIDGFRKYDNGHKIFLDKPIANKLLKHKR